LLTNETDKTDSSTMFNTILLKTEQVKVEKFAFNLFNLRFSVFESFYIPLF